MVVAKDQPTTNTYLLDWVEEMAKLCKPDDIHWVDGAGQEISLDAALKGAKSAFPATRKPR